MFERDENVRNNYYRINFNPKSYPNWILDQLFIYENDREIPLWEFSTGGNYQNNNNVYSSVIHDGPVLAFNYTAFNDIICNGDLVEHISKICDKSELQIKRVNIIGDNGDWVVLNPIVIDCMDEANSIYQKTHEIKGRKYRSVSRLRIDDTKIDGHKIFRVKDWEVAIIVDETLKQALTKYGVDEIIYEPVINIEY